jgi:serine acetyltransferase
LNVGIGAEEGVVVGAAEVVGEDVLAVHRATMQKEKKPRMKRTTP